MKATLLYLLQVIIASGLLYGYYHFFLRNNRFHQYNRFYLLLSPVVSIVIPFLNIPLYFTSAEKDSFVIQTLSSFSFSGADTATVIISLGQSSWFSWENISWLLYGSIVLMICLRILISLAKIRRLTKTHPAQQLGQVHFVNTDEPNTPFSFFRWLFWNKNIELQSPKGEQLFRHELFHIQQKHSYDVLYMELLTAICWINPFFHLMRKEIRASHEFLADRFAIRGTERWQYAELLLMQAFHTNQPLVNPFFNTQIKRRIAMITNSNKPSYQYLRKLMVLPITVVVVFLFAFNCKEKNDNLSPKPGPDTPSVQQTAGINSTTGDTTIIPGTVKIEPYFPGGDKNWKDYLQKNINASIPVDSGAPAGNYTVVVQFLVQKDGSLSEIKPLTRHGYGMEKEVHRMISSGPRWEPVMIDGKYVAAYKKQPVTFVVSEEVGAVEPTAIETGPAQFPGGEKKWKEYLDYNLKKSPLAKTKLADGAYTVVVYFQVNEEGDISGTKALTSFGNGLEEKAIQLIAKGPKWDPAVIFGKRVKATVKQPVTFIIGKGEKGFRPAQSSNSDQLPQISVTDLQKATVHQLLQVIPKAEILGFAFAIDTEDRDIVVSVNSGNHFNAGTQSLISKATAGKTITIDQIKIKIDGTERKWPSLVYEVVNQ